MNGLKAHTIKKGTSHKVSVSALVEDYTFNSPEIAFLLEAFGIIERTVQIPKCLFTSAFFFFFNLEISTSCILLMSLILKSCLLIRGTHTVECKAKQKLKKKTVIHGLNKKKIQVAAY